MSKKCSRLSQATYSKTELNKTNRLSKATRHHTNHSATQHIQPQSKFKICNRQSSQEIRLRSMSQSETISFAKRLNTIIRGKSRRSTTEHLLTYENATSEASSLPYQKKKRRKEEERMQFGKKLLKICKKAKENQQNGDQNKIQQRVKRQVNQDYDFPASNRKAKKEALLLDFNKNQQSMYSRSRKKVMKVEGEQTYSLKQKLAFQDKKFASFQSMFYRSYLKKFKDRRKLLNRKSQLMKIVSS